MIFWVVWCVKMCEDVWRCVKLCEAVWSCVKLCEAVWSCVKLCEAVWSCVKLCEDVWRCVKMCEDVWRCVKMCEDVWRCVKMCEDVWRCVKMCEDVWRCVKMCEDVWRCVKMCEDVEPNIASSIDWLEKQKEVGNRPKNTGWISVNRITKDTLSTYNTWIQISRLQKIYHPHWAKWLLENSFPLGAAYATTLRNTKPFITAIHFMQCP